ncbi:MAG: 23S rRNA (uracil(1939)-C(5))-methyltransferase RlmD [Gammaproteobacteria bacterium]
MKNVEGINEANIVDVTLEGKGVADQEGKVVFVPFTITGERVTFERARRKKKFDEAKLIEVLEPSPDRVTAKCEYFTNCGGCSIQHISEQAQIEFKQKSVLDTLSRIGKVTPENVLPPVTDKAWGYRRRARLAAKYVEKKGRTLVGFREYSAPYVADMWSCEVLHPSIASLIKPLSDMISQFSIKDKVPQIECSVAENATALVVRVLAEPSEEDIDKLTAFAEQHSVRIYLQPKGPSTVAPLNNEIFEPPLMYSLPPFGIKVEFLPIDFIQVHHEINQKMVQQAIDWLQLDDSQNILDLFCGLGNFSLPVAKHVESVFGIEGDKELVDRARHNAHINQLDNAEFKKEDLFKVDAKCEWLAKKWDAVIVDPPRAGAREVIELISKIDPAKILYISCHPATLARDADVLVNTFGYRMEKMNVLNMFPHTGHVETMALFVKD